MSKPLKWTDNPGCFERHLRRRFQNPLFPHERQNVSREDLEKAQARDAEELGEFLREFRNLTEREKVLVEMRDVPAAYFLEQSRIIGELIKKAAALGGSAFEHYPELVLRRGLIEDLLGQESFSSDFVEKLDQIKMMHEIRSESTDHPLVAQMARPDTPISRDDVFATVLTEGPIAIRAVLSSIPAGDLRIRFRAQIISMINKCILEGRVTAAEVDKELLDAVDARIVEEGDVGLLIARNSPT